MSRIIIKNVPKVFTEKEIVEHFSKVDQITDCKLLKNEDGNSRRLAFLGFKDKATAQMLKQKYDNTYLGASKIRVEIARLPGQLQEDRSRTRERPVQEKGKSKEASVTKTFETYKQIIQ
jgi:RNA recognition motif-containing protein